MDETERRCDNCYKRVISGTRCMSMVGREYCPDWKYAFELKDQLAAIPTLGAVYEANRYDTDNMMVLHVWDKNGHSYDIICPK